VHKALKEPKETQEQRVPREPLKEQLVVRVFKVHKVPPEHKEHLKGQPVVRDSKVHKV
jgi:hypothetical protein